MLEAASERCLTIRPAGAISRTAAAAGIVAAAWEALGAAVDVTRAWRSGKSESVLQHAVALQHAGARRGVREERRVKSADDCFRRIRTCAIRAVVCGTMRGRAAWGGTSTYSRRGRAMLSGAAVPIGPTVDAAE